MRRTRVYVAGPLTLGDRLANVEAACIAGRELIERGYAPMVPHLSHHIDPVDALGHATWIDVDLAWVAVSDAVLRMPGESIGADQEVAFARQRGVPVFQSIAALIESLAPRTEAA